MMAGTVPAWVHWANGVATCDRCTAKADIRSRPGDDQVAAFVLVHEDCTEDIGARPLTALTIRQRATIDIHAVLAASMPTALPEDVAKRAVAHARALCAVLQP